jgi:hypothetical protein
MDVAQELRQVLDQQDELIGPILENARRELAGLESRVRELRSLIARAEGVQSAGLTLHEAMAQVLESQGGAEMSAREIAEKVDRLGLYRKRDGTAVDSAQVHARARNYSNLFDRTSAGISIKHKYTTSDAPTHGSYEARRVTVADRSSGDEMEVEVRLSYTALATEPGTDIEQTALEKARDFVARSGFTSGERIILLLTTHGWVDSEVEE